MVNRFFKGEKPADLLLKVRNRRIFATFNLRSPGAWSVEHPSRPSKSARASA
jgi:hypothetical protein